MLTGVVANLVGVFIFLYLFWKRLKDDYLSEQLFTTSLYALLGVGLGLAISRFLFHTWWFWLSVLGVSVGTGIGIFKFRLRVFEVVEALAFSLLPWLGLAFVSDSITHLSLPSFLGFFVCALLLTLFIYFDRHYKTFSWYSSGRVGFSGLFILGIFFTIRALVAIFFPFVLSFVGKQEPLIAGLTAILFYFMVFNLAKKTI